MSISAMQQARSMYQAYTRNASKARLAGNMADAEHYTHIADHWWRVYKSEQTACVREADQAMKETA